MKKDAKIVDSRSWFILPAILACLPIRAGGVFCSSNQSAEYIRSFDRNSAIDDADIAYYNMSGTVFLRPGLSFNLSNQTILQRATVRTLGNPVLGDRTYVSHDPVWLVPNVYGVWREGGRALFAGMETVGATAVRQWPDGLPSLDLAGKQAAGYPGAASGLDGALFPSRSWLRGSSSFMAWRLGAAFRCGPRWAVAVAGRVVRARQDITGGAWAHDASGGEARPAGILIDVSSRAMGCSLEFGIDFRCHLPR